MGQQRRRRPLRGLRGPGRPCLLLYGQGGGPGHDASGAVPATLHRALAVRPSLPGLQAGPRGGPGDRPRAARHAPRCQRLGRHRRRRRRPSRGSGVIGLHSVIRRGAIFHDRPCRAQRLEGFAVMVAAQPQISGMCPARCRRHDDPHNRPGRAATCPRRNGRVGERGRFERSDVRCLRVFAEDASSVSPAHALWQTLRSRVRSGHSSDRVAVLLAGPNTQDAVHIGHPDLAVADHAGMSVLGDGVHHGLNILIKHNDV
jgi:hypothetical protein